MSHSSLDENARNIALRLLERSHEPTDSPRSVALAPDRQSTGIDIRRASLFVSWFDRLLSVHKSAADALSEEVVTMATADEENSRSDLETSLISLHRMLMAHPVATKSAYRALVAEGRKFKGTVDGAELRDRLAGSAEIRRASMLWRTLSMDMFDDNDAGELPSTYLDHLLRVIDAPNPATILGTLFTAEDET